MPYTAHHHAQLANPLFVNKATQQHVRLLYGANGEVDAVDATALPAPVDSLLLNTYYLLLTTYYSLLTTHYSLLTTCLPPWTASTRSGPRLPFRFLEAPSICSAGRVCAVPCLAWPDKVQRNEVQGSAGQWEGSGRAVEGSGGTWRASRG